MQQPWPWALACPSDRVQVGCCGTALSSAPSPCPTACMPYLKEGHVLAIVLLALLQVRAVNEGAALLGIAIACRDTTESVRYPLPHPHLENTHPTGSPPQGVTAARGSCRRAARAVGTGDGRPASQPPASPPTPHTGRGCHPQEPLAALPGRADTWSHQSASTQ